MSGSAENMKKNNKLIKIFLLSIFTFFLISSSIPAFKIRNLDDRIQLSYDLVFNKPVIEKVKISEMIYDEVILDDLPNIGCYGEPIMPVKELKILIPFSFKVFSIEAKPSEMLSLGSGYTIKPGDKDVPLLEKDNAQITIPNNGQFFLSSRRRPSSHRN